MSLKKLANILNLNIFKDDKKTENIDDKKIDTKDLSCILNSHYEQIYNSPDILGFRNLDLSKVKKK
jgi:hypothetical protein